MLNLLIEMEEFATCKQGEHEVLEVVHPESMEFKRALDLRAAGVDNRPITAQDWVREYFASSPPPVVRSPNSKQPRRHTLSREQSRSPPPRIVRRSQSSLLPKPAAPKSDSVEVLMKALSIPKYLATDFVRSGFDMSRVGALQQVLQEHNEARVQMLLTAEDQQSNELHVSAAAPAVEAKQTSEASRSRSGTMDVPSTGQLRAAPAKPTTAADTRNRVLFSKHPAERWDGSLRAHDRRSHSRKSPSRTAQRAATGRNNASSESATESVIASPPPPLPSKRSQQRLPSAHLAINCAVYGNRVRVSPRARDIVISVHAQPCPAWGTERGSEGGAREHNPRSHRRCSVEAVSFVAHLQAGAGSKPAFLHTIERARP